MTCELKCPKCKTIHNCNSRYCINCGFDLEPYIIRFKGKHLPIHFDGGIDAEDACECLGECCCEGEKKEKKQKKGCCGDCCCGC
jgi:hypothetical protein